MLAAGFADPVQDAQGVFRAVMDALARPGRLEPLATSLRPPGPLTPELAAIALTLADPDTPLWLDAPLRAAAEVAEFLRFHTGAPITDAASEAGFALIADPVSCPPFARFAQGTPDYPDRSTTLVMGMEWLSDREGLVLEGPGLRGQSQFAADPWPKDMPVRLAANRALFPLGVDLVLTAPGMVAGLPRSVRVGEREAA